MREDENYLRNLIIYTMYIAYELYKEGCLTVRPMLTNKGIEAGKHLKMSGFKPRPYEVEGAMDFLLGEGLMINEITPKGIKRMSKTMGDKWLEEMERKWRGEK